MTDLHTLKKPYCLKFNKKNAIHPFEDASSLEFFARKNDASLLVLANHIKKRPHSLTWIRTYAGDVLDMLELHVVPETARTLQQFKGEKCRVGVKPMLAFAGSRWENPVEDEYTLAKSMFADFFRGGEVSELDVEGLQLFIQFSVGEDTIGEDAVGEAKPLIHMRVYRIITKKSGQKVPRVEVEEIGPRIDFRVGRTRAADSDRWKAALKKSKSTEPRTKKNIETDTIGDKIGRIHLGRQNLGELQTRKMKGLKRNRAVEQEDNADEMMEDVIDDEDEVDERDTSKRPRTS